MRFSSLKLRDESEEFQIVFGIGMFLVDYGSEYERYTGIENFNKTFWVDVQFSVLAIPVAIGRSEGGGRVRRQTWTEKLLRLSDFFATSFPVLLSHDRWTSTWNHLESCQSTGHFVLGVRMKKKGRCAKSTMLRSAFQLFKMVATCVSAL